MTCDKTPFTCEACSAYRAQCRCPKVYSKRNGDAPDDAVYVGRPGPFGNPFIYPKMGSRATVVKLYEVWVMAPEREALRAKIKRELKGKDLLCWCAPEQCHGDVILRIANA